MIFLIIKMIFSSYHFNSVLVSVVFSCKQVTQKRGNILPVQNSDSTEKIFKSMTLSTTLE